MPQKAARHYSNANLRLNHKECPDRFGITALTISASRAEFNYVRETEFTGTRYTSRGPDLPQAFKEAGVRAQANGSFVSISATELDKAAQVVSKLYPDDKEFMASVIAYETGQQSIRVGSHDL